MKIDTRIATAMLVICALLLTTSERLMAQGAGKSAAVVLELPSSARFVGMAGVSTAMQTGDLAVFSNPAQITPRLNFSASASYQQYIASTTLAAASLSRRVGLFSVALGIQALDYGSEPEVIPDPQLGDLYGVPTGRTISASEYAVLAAAARDVGALSLGVAVKYVHQQLVNVSGDAWAADVGASFAPMRWMSLAVSARNLGENLTLAGTTAPLPRELRVGMAAVVAGRRGRGRALRRPDLSGEFVQGPGSLNVRVGTDLLFTRGETGVASVAVEADHGVSDATRVAARVGYALRPAGYDAAPWAFGGSILLRNFSIDYGYQEFRLIADATHRIGVRLARP